MTSLFNSSAFFKNSVSRHCIWFVAQQPRSINIILSYNWKKSHQKSIVFSKEVFENGTKIHYNRRREDRKTVSWTPSIGASGVGKGKELEKR